MRSRNNLNNVVIYLLTRKVNRYYPQRLYRNSAGRIKVAESKALDWSRAFLRVIPGCKLMSFWLSHQAVPPEPLLIYHRSRPALLLPKWVLRENRQNCSFGGKIQITFGCFSQSLTGTPSVPSSVLKCYRKKSKPGRAEPLHPHRPFSRSPPVSFRTSKGIHLLSQNECLCAAQLMRLSREI